MKLIDTNIVLYSMGRPHEYQAECRIVLRRVYDGTIEAAVNSEVLQEILHYFRRQNRLAEGLRAFDDVMLALEAPLPIDRETCHRARNILERYPHLQSRDAFHAATVFQYELEGIISADRGFDAVAGLTRFDPSALAAS